MRRGPHYWLFKAVAKYQYSVSDRIGIESPRNRKYFGTKDKRIEVLRNWIASGPPRQEAYELPPMLKGRRVIVYAGNVGVAQDMDNVLRLAQRLSSRADIGLFIVGSGTESRRIEASAGMLGLSNVVFNQEVDPTELRALLSKCDVGLVTLDRRLKSHNIPGKLLAYIQAGLPILGSVNPGNEVKDVVEGAGAGIVLWNGEDEALANAAVYMCDNTSDRTRMARHAVQLCADVFSADSAAAQLSRFFCAQTPEECCARLEAAPRGLAR
jgi:glycosyltransferase involved in cell wall biosynthesis